MEDFDDASKALIGSEGGYSFNPADPGCRAARRRFPAVCARRAGADLLGRFLSHFLSLFPKNG